MRNISVLPLYVLLLVSSAPLSHAQMPSQVPATEGSQTQPQGPTGPITTGSGGAPAESPQGETPPSMQSAPQGSGGSTSTTPSGQTKQDTK